MVTPHYSLESPAVPYDALRHPFIDRFGQFAHADWPDKVHDETELTADLARERDALAASPAPSSWDKFGGWAAGPTLPIASANGGGPSPAGRHFTVARHSGRWWLVTPEGHLFFSFGVDTLRHQTDVANGHRHPGWYETPPPKSGMMAFTHWNLQRKFGKMDYVSDYYRFMHARLRAWGFNTIGRWSAWRLPAAGRTPYLMQLDSPAKAPRIPGTNIYDVFHPDFEKKFTEGVTAQTVRNPSIAAAVDCPFCIGLSIDNELAVNVMPSVTMAQDFRASSAKNAFFEFVRGKYRTLTAVNGAWGTRLATWPELARLQAPLPGAGFAADSYAFMLEWLRRYFRTARAALKAIAPNKLYFAAAFDGMEQPVAAWDAASEFADVLIANVHERDAETLRPLTSAGVPEKPLLIGAFTFGCLDRGMFAAGPVPCASQQARADALRAFMRGALENPLVVGCHYFQYRDQPLIGRGDGEAYEIGLVDVCDRPYGEMTAAAREIGERLYGGLCNA